MEVKKYKKADVESKRFDFRLAGISLAFLLVFAAFSYTTYDKKEKKKKKSDTQEEVQIIENTVQLKKKPPPPPPPILEIIEDDEEIPEEQPDLEETDADQEKEIEKYDDKPQDRGPEEDDNKVYDFFALQDPATFEGGQEDLHRFIQENTEFPAQALDNDMGGVVLVQFVVGKTGELTDFKIMSEVIGFGLEEEAIRVLKLTSGIWKPAKQQLKPVAMRFQIPVNFTSY